MAFLIIFVALGLIPAFIAQKRGRDFGGWWIYGALVFPIALIHSLLLEPDKIAIEERLVSE